MFVGLVVRIGRGDDAGKLVIGRAHPGTMTNGTSEVTQGGQFPLGSGGGDLEGVLTLDGVGLIEGL